MFYSLASIWVSTEDLWCADKCSWSISDNVGYVWWPQETGYPDNLLLASPWLLSSAYGRSLVGLGAPLSPLPSVQLLWVIELFLCANASDEHFTVLFHVITMTIGDCSSGLRFIEDKPPERPLLLRSGEGTQTHVWLAPEFTVLTTVAFCPSTRLFSKCYDSYIGLSFI